jgi:hypothetical protein
VKGPKVEDLLLTLVDRYTSTTSAQDVAAAEKKSRLSQKASAAKSTQLLDARRGIYLAFGLTAGVILLYAARTVSRAQEI